MRQPKNNRRLYLLPLLFFACTGPTLVAQTWTTVWTPGSAPAAKTAANDDTHESKTNRPPCSEWDEYSREWQKFYDPDSQGCCVHR